MAELMVRKQIYLPRRQNLLLKRLAKQRGVSEAEVIRQALEHETTLATSFLLRDKKVIWEEIKKFVQARMATFAGEGKPIRWNRQEIYKERENRWLKPKMD